MLKELNPKKGQLLIAEPSILGDVSFTRSVILLADHNDEGSVGFILNKPLDFTLNELVQDVSAPFTIYNGGPVEQDNLYFIHTVPHLIPDSVEISNGIYWAGDFNEVVKLIEKNTITENDIRFFLGYSGWHSEQLENELDANSWVLSDNVYKTAIIKKSNNSIWKDKMMELGESYSIWANAPENPSHN